MLNEQSNKRFRGSFIKFIAEEIGLQDIPEPIKEEWGYSLLLDGNDGTGNRCHCFFLITSLRANKILQTKLTQVRPGDHVVVGIAPSGKSGLIQRKHHWKELLHYLKSAGYSITGLFAVDPSPWDTHIMFDLQNNILRYVESVSLRYLDGPIKHHAKKFSMQILGTDSWRGWIVATFNTSKEKSILPEITDHYLILTPDRVISLTFENGKTSPVFVTKQGPYASLQREHRNHMWAREKLGNSVPGIYDFSSKVDTASLKMEYIPERNMINVVAQSLSRKGKLESETLALLDFFQFAFNSLVGDQPNQKLPLPDLIYTVTKQGLDYLFESAKKTPLIQELYASLKEMEFLLIPQHGDFCVRNILYRDSGEKVLIDWEDSDLLMLPCIDLNMLLVSLAEAWARFFANDESAYNRSTAIKQHLAEVEASLRQYLNMTDREWRICSLLSLAYLAGINISKGRGATAAIIKKEFRWKVNSSRSY